MYFPLPVWIRTTIYLTSLVPALVPLISLLQEWSERPFAQWEPGISRPDSKPCKAFLLSTEPSKLWRGWPQLWPCFPEILKLRLLQCAFPSLGTPQARERWKEREKRRRKERKEEKEGKKEEREMRRKWGRGKETDRHAGTLGPQPTAV